MNSTLTSSVGVYRYGFTMIRYIHTYRYMAHGMTLVSIYAIFNYTSSAVDKRSPSRQMRPITLSGDPTWSHKSPVGGPSSPPERYTFLHLVHSFNIYLICNIIHYNKKCKFFQQKTKKMCLWLQNHIFKISWVTKKQVGRPSFPSWVVRWTSHEFGLIQSALYKMCLH